MDNGSPPRLTGAASKALMLPQTPEGWNAFGLTLRKQDRLGEAIRAYDQAIALKKDYPEAYFHRANAQWLLGHTELALLSYNCAVARDPSFAEAHYNRGALLEALDRWDDAAASYETAIALRPEFPEALNNLGNVSRAVCRYEEALAAYDRAIALRPSYAEALTNRGNVLRDLHRYREALESHERALALQPGLIEAYNNRASVHRDMSRFDAALADYRHVLARAPGHIEARWSLGLTQLLLGDWGQGWESYELRFRKRQNTSRRPNHPAPEWLGEPLAGRHILLFGEQGKGDVIQFIRYAPLLEAMGATVTVLTHRCLHRLLASASAATNFVSAVTPDMPFDFQIALMSIPRVVGTRVDNAPARIPYLAADARRAETWRARLGNHGFRVGLCWQGNPAGSIDNGRSLPLRNFAPLAAIDRVRLISLQKYYGVEQLERRPAGMVVEAPSHDFDDGTDAFIDTAALMMNLDLVVTSDTSIAHLAGALGRPVWIALKHVPDWRWLLGRPDSVWYPTARLFRQHAIDDWAGVVWDPLESTCRHASLSIL